MKPTASKRMIRIEKKKKKMAALLEISKLNEYDRIAKSLHTAENNSLTPSPEIEPNPKRLRTELNEASVLDIIIEQDNKQDKESIGIGLSGKPKVQGEEYIKLKKVLRERKLNMKAQPMLRLRELGEYAKLNADVDSRIPLFLTDIQHLLMYSQLGHHSPYSPARWCALDKFNKISSTVVLIIENMSLYYYWAHGELFPFMNSAFDYELEFLSPAAYKSDFIQDLAMVPITSSQMRKFINEYGTLETAVVKSNDLFDRIRNLFPVSDTETSEAPIPGLPPGDKFPRTQLLLSGWQMVEENFPLPIKGLMDTKYYGYVLTKDEYKDVTPFSPLLAIDCEMCRTTTGDLEVTRVSIVNENMEVFYEQLVKPDNRIVDYLTQFSGITAKMMRNVTKRLQDVQEDLRRMLPADCILVGQSLANDMHALKMMHPYIIDTSVIFNITGERSRKTKLQTLSREFLSERIQEGRGGHCSVEDSMACMKLVKHRLSKSLYYGDAVMGGLKNDLRQYPNLGDANYATSMLKHVTKVDKTVRVVGLPDIAAKYIYYTFKELESKDPKKIKCVAENCRDRVVNQISEDTFSYSLNIAHIKITNTELEGDPERTIQNVDNWAKKVYNSTPHLGLCMVIFGGNNNENGCCFIKLKRQI